MSVAGDDGDRAKTTPAQSREIAHQRTLGTEGESVARVLDIGPDNDASVDRDGARADGDVRVRCVRRGRCVTGLFT